jgi:hypothetical protein
MMDEYQPLNWKLGMVSPTMFNKFVCYEIGETLAVSNKGWQGGYRQDQPPASK